MATPVFSRKVVVQFLVTVLTIGATYAVTKLGLGDSLGTSAIISGVVGQLAGLLAGYLAKEVPGVFGESQ